MIGSAVHVDAPRRYESLEGVGGWVPVDASANLSLYLSSVDLFDKFVPARNYKIPPLED